MKINAVRVGEVQKQTGFWSSGSTLAHAAAPAISALVDFTVRTSASRHSAAQRHLADTPTNFLKILFIIMLFLVMCLNHTHGLGVVSKAVKPHWRPAACWTSSRVSQMFRLDSQNPNSKSRQHWQLQGSDFAPQILSLLYKFKRALNLNCHNYFALRCEPVLFLYFLLYMFYVFNLKCILMYQCRALWQSLLYWIVNKVDWLIAKKTDI